MSTLKIYRAASGQWSGVIIDSDGEEIGRIAGCDSAEDVEEEAYNIGEPIDAVEQIEREKPTGG